MSELLLALAVGAAALQGFPRDAGGRIGSPAVAAVVGGAPAVVVAAGSRLVGFRADGSPVPGLALPLGDGDEAAGAPAAADMDADGRHELAIATRGGKVFLWVGGGVVPGFPLNLGAPVRGGVSFGDVDGDGRPELLVGDEKGRVHALKRNGRQPVGWPATIGCAVTSSASASNLAGGRAIAVGCQDGAVHVLDGAGRPRSGFPLVTKFTVSGAPAFADLDDDGEFELVVASQDFGLHAVDARGKPLPGFPARAGYRLYEGPAIADLDGDGGLDVAFASADGMIHAVDAGGVPLRGFPARIGQRIFGGVAVGDLDRDGGLDLVAMTADGAVAALDAKGRPLPGFPAPLGGADATASPLLVDLGGDGTLSAFVGLPAGALHAVRASRVGTAAARVPWPAPARDGARTGRFGPNPPRLLELVLAPAEPRAADVLRASWRTSWLDAAPGEAPPAAKLEWRRNGARVPGLDGKTELPPGTVRRGERWRFVLAGGSAPAESPEVTVLDTPPGAPAVALEPAVPTRGADVRATLATPAVDPDGDPLAYAFSWLLDGEETGVTGEIFPAARLRRGALLAVRAVASDGERSGPPAHAQARVGDTAPGTPEIALAPEAPARGEAVEVRVRVPAIDADGDPLVYHHAWRVDGELRPVPAEAAALPAALFRKHQKIEVEVRAFDGEREGPPARAAATARNSPPGAPAVEIRPGAPRRGDPLRAAIVAPAPDPDRDPVSYAFAWRKNGKPFAPGGDGREVPGAEVARGDVFELTVTPSDGESPGPAATATVTVRNTPPLPPRIALEPRRPRGGEPLRAVVLAPARDPDGDPVSLSFSWTREGRPTGAGADRLAPGEHAKHERVRVVATPHDGTDAGAPATDEVLVEDAPPGAPAIAFASERPTVAEPLRIAVRTPAPDPDGDEVRYLHRWTRDGVPFAVPDETPESREPPSFWTSSAAVPAEALAKGQRWAVEVRAHDGEQVGPPVRAEVVVANAPPPPPRLAFSPARPTRVDGLRLAIEQPPDPDGDAVTWRYAWTRDGARHDAPPEQGQIPRGVARRGERWAAVVVASDGEAESPPARAEVVIADAPPGPVAIGLCDGPVAAGAVPQARVLAPAPDPDGDAVSYRYEWSVNGKAVAAAAGRDRLAAPPLAKHDRVRVVVTPFDGELAGPAAAAECEVANTPPTAPVAALEPAEPTAGRGASVVVRRGSTDADGDRVVYRHAWSRDGAPMSLDGAVPPAMMRHGEVWRVVVTPFDGEQEGEGVVLQATVANTPPPAPAAVSISPASPVSGEALTCAATAPAADADGEAIAVRYRWSRGDRADALGEGSDTLPAGVVRRGERWRCEAWTSDGAAESARASAEVAVRNTPPSAPRIAIEPARPRRGDALACRLAAPAEDADGDPVSYAFAWTESGRPVPPGPDPARVDPARVTKGDAWRCTVTPSDGSAAGPQVAAEVRVGNRPPAPAVVRVQPAAPRHGEPIRCAVDVRSEDPDADTVRYRYAWQRNGAAQPFAESSQEVPARLAKAGDRWRCIVTPSDGEEDGPPSISEEVEVGDPPPEAPRAVAPAPPVRPGRRAPR